MSNIINIVWVLVLLLVSAAPTTASLIEWEDGGDYTVRAQENWAQMVFVGFTYIGQEPRMIAAEWDYNVSYMGYLWPRCTYMDKNDEYYSTNVVHFSVDYNGTPAYNTIRVFDSETNQTLGRARVIIREGKAKRYYDLYIMSKPVQFHELDFALLDDFTILRRKSPRL